MAKKIGKFISSDSKKQGSQAKRGTLIVIEGSDGSGKTEQTRLLCQYLKQKKIPFVMFDFPQYNSFYGQLVGRRLAGEFGKNIPPEYAALPYALDRLMVKERLKQALSSGKHVIANRYISSNTAHMSALAQPGKRQQVMDWIGQMEYGVNGMPKADLTFFLWMKQSIAKKLLVKKGARVYLGKKKKDLHEANHKFMEDSIRQYLKIAQKDKKWQVIKCFQGYLPKTIDQIHKELVKSIKNHI